MPGAPVKKIRKKKPSYASYIHKVLKQVHPKLGIGSTAMLCLNGITEDLEDRLTKESVKYAKFSRKSTLSAQHVQTATHTMLPGDMAGHAVSEGTKAVTRYFAKE